MLRLTVVDYQLGNLFSVVRACGLLGYSARVSSKPDDVVEADAIILPGVGAFGQAMDNLSKLQLKEPLLRHIAGGKPFFGICLGMQLLFEESEEFGSPRGLCAMRGRVRRLPVSNAPVPQIGWNEIAPPQSSGHLWARTPLAAVQPGAWMYFVHSFYVANQDGEDACCETDYAGFRYTSGIFRKNIFATQFHPEKSSHEGLSIYRAWLQSLSASSPSA